MKKISAKVEGSQFINQTPVNQIALKNGKTSIYGLPEDAEESLVSDMIEGLQKMIREMNNQIEESHRDKISKKYDEEVEHMYEKIQRYIKDSKESFIQLVWD